jgi:hypothetical protein
MEQSQQIVYFCFFVDDPATPRQVERAAIPHRLVDSISPALATPHMETPDKPSLL